MFLVSRLSGFGKLDTLRSTMNYQVGKQSNTTFLTSSVIFDECLILLSQTMDIQKGLTSCCRNSNKRIPE